MQVGGDTARANDEEVDEFEFPDFPHYQPLALHKNAIRLSHQVARASVRASDMGGRRGQHSGASMRRSQNIGRIESS